MSTATATHIEPGERGHPSGAGALGILQARRDRMHTEREARLSMLRGEIARGEYRVDPYAIADAILYRAMRGMSHPAQAPQKECSYPVSAPSASVKTTPVGPSTTRPSTVKPTLSVAASQSPRALGGMQTHSS